MMRFPLELPPVAKPRKRHLIRGYFFGVLGVLLSWAFLIFFFGLLTALNE